MSGLELVVFDCDGVLIDSEVLACRAVAEELAALGYDYSTEIIARRFAGLRDEELAAVIGRENGRELPPDFPDSVARRAMHAFERELEPLPGAAELLADLALPKCVASNSQSARLDRSLEIVGLRAYFPPQAVFSADLVSRGKPAPDLHLYAAEQMRARPQACLVIEDSQSGVAAARAAGMAALGFTGASHVENAHGARLLQAGAFEVVEDFAAVAAVLGRL